VYIKTNYTTCSSQQHILNQVNDLDYKSMWSIACCNNTTTFNNQATTSLNINNIATTTYSLGDRGGSTHALHILQCNLKKSNKNYQVSGVTLLTFTLKYDIIFL
jgi:hypothetical protein